MTPLASWLCFIGGGALIAWAVADAVRAIMRGDPNPALAVLEAEAAIGPLVQPAKAEPSIQIEQDGPDDWRVTIVDDEGVSIVGGLPADEARIFAESWARL